MVMMCCYYCSVSQSIFVFNNQGIQKKYTPAATEPFCHGRCVLVSAMTLAGTAGYQAFLILLSAAACIVRIGRLADIQLPCIHQAWTAEPVFSQRDFQRGKAISWWIRYMT